MPSVTSVLRGLRFGMRGRLRRWNRPAREPALQSPLVTTTFDVRSGDGTVVRGWRSDSEGVPLVISNGLGTVPAAWLALVRPDSGYRACSWYHRDTFGSDRPADPARIRVEDHVGDMLALMDSEGIDRALVACWSIGVNIGFEFARRHPDRVAGLMAVAGVPGGTFGAMGAPWRIPSTLRRPIAVRVTKALRTAGPVLTWLAPRVPVNDRTAWVLTHSGLLTDAARPELLVPMLREFLLHDWTWYMHLAVAASEHEGMDLSSIRCPTTLVAGRRDLLTSMQDVVDAAARIPQAQVTVLPGTHFLPLEYPGLVHAALDELRRRSELVGP